MESTIKKYPCYINGVEQVYPNVAPGTPIYANAVAVDNILYVSGMTPQSFENGGCVTNTMETQMWDALLKMKQVLEDAGSCLENVFKTFIMLKDIKDYPVMRATELKFYQQYAPELVESPPGSTILQAGCLARPEFLVEIECNAVINRKKD
ncbi:MAG: RidA family protein [Lachnospiraceae bacterium]|nr:RidA family protein [Lachnospiraceae bacterium]